MLNNQLFSRSVSFSVCLLYSSDFIYRFVVQVLSISFVRSLLVFSFLLWQKNHICWCITSNSIVLIDSWFTVSLCSCVGNEFLLLDKVHTLHYIFFSLNSYIMCLCVLSLFRLSATTKKLLFFRFMFPENFCQKNLSY